MVSTLPERGVNRVCESTLEEFQENERGRGEQ